MKCPWCNAEIEDGSLYCTVCGEEIHIVPEFDPEMEDQFRETMEAISKDIFDDNDKNHDNKSETSSTLGSGDNAISTGERSKIASEEHSVTNKESKTEVHNKSKNIFVIIFVIFFIVAIIVAAIFIFVHVSSDSYKLGQARKAFDAGEYDKATTLYSDVLSNDKYNIEILIEYGKALYANNDIDSYLDNQFFIAQSSDATEEQRYECYKNIIGIYENREEYSKIREVLISAGNSTLMFEYYDYLSSKITYSLEEGTYDLPQILTIECDDDIYYSLTNEINGEVTELVYDSLYDGSIWLEQGLYTLSVYSKNKYGLDSDWEYKEYNIELIPPLPPEINLESGTYDSPEFIELYYADDSFKVYYTVDGSTPNENSILYTGKIMLPYGDSNYSFACLDEYGLWSEVLRVSYRTNYYYEISMDDSKTLLLGYLLDKGTIVSMDGSMPEGGMLGLELVGFEIINNDYHYIYEETLIYQDVASLMDVRYAVNMMTGEISKLD